MFVMCADGEGFVHKMWDYILCVPRPLVTSVGPRPRGFGAA